MKVDLESYKPSYEHRENSYFVLILWYAVSVLFFRSYLFPFRGLKVFLLRLFGAKLGVGINIKPGINIKYPWKLVVGSHCWLGEKVWIDNLDRVTIGDNVCISQGAMLLTGNHDYSKMTFDLRCEPIILEDGVWIGAKSIVCPGVRCKSHSVLSVGSVATSDLQPYSIYQGNPAKKIRERTIS